MTLVYIYTTKGLIQSFVFIGRPYFHKNKKYEFACQLTEAIIKKGRCYGKIKYVTRFRMHCTFNEYENSCSAKPKVETGGKYKCLLCMGVARIDGRGK